MVIHSVLDLTVWLIDDEIHDELRGTLDVQARLLYGLIHARWIVTARGLAKMVFLVRSIYKVSSFHSVVFTQLEKYKRVDFGRCPRVLCQSQPLLPVGLTDVAYEKSVKLYCGRCEDIYSPKSSRHGSIDGAYFGTSFPHLLFMCYPALIPTKSGPMDGPGFRGGAPESTESSATGGKRPRRGREDSATGETVGSEVTSTAAVALKTERYQPRIFGFQVNEIAKLQRWQEAVRDRLEPFSVFRDVITHTSPGKSHDWKNGKKPTSDRLSNTTHHHFRSDPPRKGTFDYPIPLVKVRGVRAALSSPSTDHDLYDLKDKETSGMKRRTKPPTSVCRIYALCTNYGP